MHIKSMVWDGSSLSIIIGIDDREVTCVIPRNTVHALPHYNDAVSWEIDRHKADIFERVKAMLERKLTQQRQESVRIELSPSDLAA